MDDADAKKEKKEELIKEIDILTSELTNLRNETKTYTEGKEKKNAESEASEGRLTEDNIKVDKKKPETELTQIKKGIKEEITNLRYVLLVLKLLEIRKDCIDTPNEKSEQRCPVHKNDNDDDKKTTHIPKDDKITQEMLKIKKEISILEAGNLTPTQLSLKLIRKLPSSPSTSATSSSTSSTSTPNDETGLKLKLLKLVLAVGDKWYNILRVDTDIVIQLSDDEKGFLKDKLGRIYWNILILTKQINPFIKWLSVKINTDNKNKTQFKSLFDVDYDAECVQYMIHNFCSVDDQDFDIPFDTGGGNEDDEKYEKKKMAYADAESNQEWPYIVVAKEDVKDEQQVKYYRVKEDWIRELKDDKNCNDAWCNYTLKDLKRCKTCQYAKKYIPALTHPEVGFKPGASVATNRYKVQIVKDFTLPGFYKISFQKNDTQKEEFYIHNCILCSAVQNITPDDKKNTFKKNLINLMTYEVLGSDYWNKHAPIPISLLPYSDYTEKYIAVVLDGDIKDNVKQRGIRMYNFYYILSYWLDQDSTEFLTYMLKQICSSATPPLNMLCQSEAKFTPEYVLKSLHLRFNADQFVRIKQKKQADHDRKVMNFLMNYEIIDYNAHSFFMRELWPGIVNAVCSTSLSKNEILFELTREILEETEQFIKQINVYRPIPNSREMSTVSRVRFLSKYRQWQNRQRQQQYPANTVGQRSYSSMVPRRSQFSRRQDQYAQPAPMSVHVGRDLLLTMAEDLKSIPDFEVRNAFNNYLQQFPCTKFRCRGTPSSRNVLNFPQYMSRDISNSFYQMCIYFMFRICRKCVQYEVLNLRTFLEYHSNINDNYL